MKPATITRDAPYRKEETALLFVDLQTIYCTPGLDPAHPELDENHYYFKRLKATTIPNAERLLNAARKSGKVLMAGMSHRYRPDAAALSSFVAGGLSLSTLNPAAAFSSSIQLSCSFAFRVRFARPNFRRFTRSRRSMIVSWRMVTRSPLGT